MPTTSTEVRAAIADKKALMRDKRAQGIAAMGLVTREGDYFRVATPTLRGRKTSYEVRRDDTGRVRCTCLEYEESSADDAAFRCEHILAVKHSLLARNTEAVTKQPPVNQPAVSESVATPEEIAATLNTNANASEKRVAHNKAAQPAATVETAPRFERERDESQKTVPVKKDAASNLRSLAEHTDREDLTDMTKHRENTATAAAVTKPVLAPEVETENEYETTADFAAPVVQLRPEGFASTLRTLRQPVDPKLVKTREGWTDRQGNTHMVEYIEWHTVADMLDRVAPEWSHAVRDIKQIGDMVAVTAAITIDNVTREGVGTGTADNETGIKKAEHDALKRAAIKFGIARDLYQRESDVIEKTGATQPGEFPRDPLAKSMADLVTPKQLGMIRALGREAGVDVDVECQTVLRCKTDELSKRAASSFIDHLKGLQQEAAANGNNGMRRAS
ncbi:MAG: Rad52/Rad22 family DNA repair protein [Pyrinomonadaceae bacterium]